MTLGVRSDARNMHVENFGQKAFNFGEKSKILVKNRNFGQKA